MKKYVIDTSALMGIIEENKAVMDLYSRMAHGNIELVAPEYLLVEFANAMRMGKKKPITEVLGMISRLRSSGIKFVRIASDEMDLVVKESFASDLTVYDAIYAYLARKLNLKLITEDKKILGLPDIAIKPEDVSVVPTFEMSPKMVSMVKKAIEDGKNGKTKKWKFGENI